MMARKQKKSIREQLILVFFFSSGTVKACPTARNEVPQSVTISFPKQAKRERQKQSAVAEMTDIVISIAAKVGEYLVSPIERQLRYLFCYRSYTDDLNNKVQELGHVRDDIQRTVDAETNRAGYEIRPIVQDWLNRVAGITGEAEELMNDENRSCFNGWCPNFKSRYLLGRKAEEKAQEIVQIKIEGNFPHGVSDLVPIRNLTFKNYEPFDSRASILKKIMDAIGDDEIKMVGVRGMGGVGKTTLVKQVAEQAKQRNLFTTEVYIDVSWTRDLEKPQQGIAKIQQKIAEMLGLKFMREDESTRAVELNHRLKKEKILIILDDIWKEIDLEEVGIPCKDDPTECKVVLTSRDLQLIRQYMDEETCFLIQQLPPEEAWSLFNKTSGGSLEKNLELGPIATDVVEECEGLPIAIVTIAKALKGKNVAVWKNALNELSTSAPKNIQGVEKKVYSCLELSYNHLESDEVKSLFLLCGLLGNGNVSLDDLLKYGMGLDLFDNIDSLEQARDRVVALVKILKDSSLLLDPFEDGHYSFEDDRSLFFAEEDNGFVRMHDVVRDVCKAIGSKDHGFVVKEAVGLQGWQQRVHELGNCTRISLNCRDIRVLPGGLVCPKLQFFLVNSDQHLLKIPDAFFKEMKELLKIPDASFKEMKELRVLRLLGIWDPLKSSSLHLLSNLRTLCLHRCWISGGIEILGELKKLQILSFVGCNYIVLPKEMSQLTDLRMLTFRGTEILDPENVISSLSQLQHLCIRSRRVDNDFFRCELKHLSCLRALELRMPFSSLLLDDVSLKNLTRYDISIGPKSPSIVYDGRRRTSRRTSRRLILNVVDAQHLVRCFSRLLKTVEVLSLKDLNDTKHFFNELDCDGFPKLKYLSISLSGAMQDIINTMDDEWVDPPHSAFPRLEDLRLRDLEQLQAVWRGPIRISWFTKLRVLFIRLCRSLKYIIWLPTTQARESVLVFPQLGTLRLEGMPNLINFYSTGASGSQEPCSSFFNQVALPRLESLHLKLSLDNVRTMWDSQDSVDCFQNLNSLRISGLTSLKYLFPASVVKGLTQLKDLSISFCGVEEIVANENGVEPVPMFEFPSLTSLQLWGLGQLKRFYREKYTLSCPLLENLDVVDCDKVELLFQEKCLEEELDEQPLFLIEKVALPRLESLHLKLSLDNVRTMWDSQDPVGCFQNLNSLRISGLTSLKYLFPASVVKGLKQLKDLSISFCGVEEIVANENGVEAVPMFEFPSLTSLELFGLGQLKRFYREKYTLSCPLLKKLYVGRCDKVELLFQEKCLEGELDEQPLFLIEKSTFPNVEELMLSFTGPMEIWRGQFSRESFGKLRVLMITMCEGIPVAIPCSKLPVLQNLEKLFVLNCNSVEEVIQEEGLAGETIPRLTEIFLRSLPSLMHLSGLQPILQNLHSLEVYGCDNLMNLVSPSMAKRLVQLKELSITDCSMVKEIVGADVTEATDDISFTNLEKLQLGNLVVLESFSSASNTFKFPSLEKVEIEQLPRLTHLYRIIPGLGQNLQKLRILEVSGCGNLEILLTPAMAKALEQLENLTVTDCETLKKIVENGGEATDDEIVNTKLQKLELYNLPILKSFCSASCTFKFPSLTQIWITDCPQMEYFCMGHSMTPRLEEFYMNGVSLDLENDLNTIIRNYFTEWVEDCQEEVPDEEDAEEGDSEEQHPKVVSSVEEDTEGENSEGGGSGSP
ncbi:probable disease resistance protein At4g27220 isoform X2 [Vitis riparia]|uniref:probable disease resistance protein At4g27220 isoform X2 n=1 Tax=Vitis riparia TaxID=96939 RepID=UPI00155A1F8A|nr:probable disease resistance protein At4g27220 isoform X2 [Vitis riparia]